MARSIPMQRPNDARRHVAQVRAGDVVTERGRPRWRSRLAPALAAVACLALIAVVVGVLTSAGKTSAQEEPQARLEQAIAAHTSSVNTMCGDGLRNRRRAQQPHQCRVICPLPRPNSSNPPLYQSSSGTIIAAPVTTATPPGVVQSFYEAAARHDYTAAWTLADESMRNQLAGFEGFKAQMSRVRVITFHQAQTVQQGLSSAAVSVDTTAVLLDRTQHCSGTAQTLHTASGAWLLDHISIGCTSV
jgi:hypothetical protein